MKLKKIIDVASVLLGVDCRDILFRCANLCVSNVACNLKDCVTEQTFIVTDGKIYYNQFNYQFLKVRECNVRYEIYTDFIAVPNGKVVIEYAYIPCFTKQTEDISKIGGVMNGDVLLYGILAEYASISGLWDEYKMYNEKFQILLFNQHRGKGVRVMI